MFNLGDILERKVSYCIVYFRIETILVHTVTGTIIYCGDKDVAVHTITFPIKYILNGIDGFIGKFSPSALSENKFNMLVKLCNNGE
jgi:hypothetical protein